MSGVKSVDEVVEFKTVIDDITPKKTRNSISYDLKLNEYNNLFRVVANYEDLFNYQSINQDVKANQNLYFAISLKDYKNLNTSKKINILGIRSISKVYLDKQETIEKDRIIRNYITTIGGTILILLSFGVYSYRRFYYRLDI